MNKFFLKSEKTTSDAKLGKISGVAYSGSMIKNFNCYQNFIVDMSSLTVAKEKTVLLRDHDALKVVGVSSVIINENEVNIDGTITKKTEEGKEILALSEDGIEWELSIGVYDGSVEEGFSGEVNGIEVENANVLRNGVLREVSVVALGADINTNTNILSQQKMESLKMNKIQFKKLAKAFKLAEDAEIEEVLERAEEIVEEVAEAKEEVAEVKSEVDEKDALIKQLQEELEALKAELDAIKEESEVDERMEEVEASLKKAGVQMSAVKIREIAKSKAGAELFISSFSDVKPSGRIPVEMCQKDTFAEARREKTASLREEANALIKEGKAKDFMAALKIINSRQGK